MTAEEVKTSELREKDLALLEIYQSESVDISADMLAVVALAVYSLKLQRQVPNRVQALIEVKPKLQVVS